MSELPKRKGEMKFGNIVVVVVDTKEKICSTCFLLAVTCSFAEIESGFAYRSVAGDRVLVVSEKEPLSSPRKSF